MNISASTLQEITISVQNGSVLGAFAKLRKATVSFAMLIRPSGWNNSAATDVFS
jgi:hypothetical protein